MGKGEREEEDRETGTERHKEWEKIGRDRGGQRRVGRGRKTKRGEKRKARERKHS